VWIALIADSSRVGIAHRLWSGGRCPPYQLTKKPRWTSASSVESRPPSHRGGFAFYEGVDDLAPDPRLTRRLFIIFLD
jgi:hypothetical protein